jgi:hypothetical protein
MRFTTRLQRLEARAADPDELLGFIVDLGFDGEPSVPSGPNVVVIDLAPPDEARPANRLQEVEQ